MFAGADLESRLPDMQDQLARAQVVTPDLMSKVVAGACNRIAMPSCADKAAKIDRLIESEAWTEAALALVELELPQWTLHRLVYEEDAWLCSLSKQWNVRVWLTDCAETRHRSLPIAILSALIEAQQCAEPSSMRAASSVPLCGVESSFPSKRCAATTSRESIGGMVINPLRRRLAMFASRPNRARSRRARSAEEESPVIVGSIAIPAAIVFNCMGMIAPILWDAFSDGAGCAGARRAAAKEVAPRARRPARTVRPYKRSDRDRRRSSIRLFRTYEIGSDPPSNSYASVSTLLTWAFRRRASDARSDQQDFSCDREDIGKGLVAVFTPAAFRRTSTGGSGKSGGRVVSRPLPSFI
jgi:hypothetical protein